MKHKYPETYTTADGSLTIYKDRAGDLRWRIVGKNGKKIDAATEGYRTRRALRHGMVLACGVLLKGIRDSAPGARP